MVARLEIKLAAKEPLSNQMASVFQGVLMELLPEKYAAYLHESSLHPYSQHLEMKDKCWYWVINCLNQEATEIILMNVLMKKNSIMLKKQKLEVKFTEKRYSELGDKELLHNFYNEEKSRYLNLHFITPTAFKQAGKYLFYPDLRCMYQSCMNKYDAVVKDESMIDEETLEQLCENSRVIRYDLKSVPFHLEGIKIPAFIGKITIKLTGTQTFANFAHLLLQFGTYSGIGIKTAIGMGAVKILDEGRRRE